MGGPAEGSTRSKHHSSSMQPNTRPAVLVPKRMIRREKFEKLHIKMPSIRFALTADFVLIDWILLPALMLAALLNAARRRWRVANLLAQDKLRFFPDSQGAQSVS
jgi:hypothetical protein